jgi:hypothetical protein
MKRASTQIMALAMGLMATGLVMAGSAQAEESRRIPPDPNVKLQGFICRNVNPYNEETPVICRGRANRNDVRYFYAFRGAGGSLFYRDSTTGQTLAAGSEGSTNLLTPGIINIQVPSNSTGGGIQIRPEGSTGIQVLPNTPNQGGGIQIRPNNSGSTNTQPGQGVIIIKPNN